MKKLKLISIEYENLILESARKSREYFENHDVNDLITASSSGTTPTFKVLEKEAERKIAAFIDQANTLAATNGFTKKELHIKISNQILKNDPPQINIFLLINLMWEAEPGKGNYCFTTIESLLKRLLSPELIDRSSGYYIESLIDIWNSDTHELIPVEILESIMIKGYNEEYSYSPFIKASSYLQDHPEEIVESVILKIKESKRYKEDDYYREWIT